MATVIKEPPVPTDAEWAERLDGFVQRAHEASIALRKLDQEAVDRIVWAMTVAGLENAVELAELAMEETHFGVLEDKVLKNYIATEFLYDYLRDKKSVGVIDEDRERGLQYVAEPIGVVLALLPITNPTSTTLFKSIVCAKTRNALIMRPSPRAVRCCGRAGELLQEAGEAVGLPPNSLQVIPDPRSRCRSTCSTTRGSTSSGRPGGRRRWRPPTPPGSRASASDPVTRLCTCTAAPTSGWRSWTCSSRRRSTPR